MIYFEKIAMGIDVSGVMAGLKDHPELWNQHDSRRVLPGTPHRASSDIWVRGRDVAPFEAGEKPWSEFPGEHIPINYPAWDALPSLRRLILELMATVGGLMLGGVLITKIPPGSGIDLHVDRGWHPEYFEKFYLSLQSAPGAVFGCEFRSVREEIAPMAGDVWKFDNRLPHWVFNGSPIDRITAIICIKTAYDDRKSLEEL